MNYFLGIIGFNQLQKNHWLWNYPFYLRYLIRGFDRLIFNDRFINECVLASTPGKSHFGLTQ